MYDKTSTVNVSKKHYVPELKTDLMSVNAIVKKEHRVFFDLEREKILNMLQCQLSILMDYLFRL